MSTEPAPTPQAESSAGTFARVSGKVQGVNYRNTTKRKAEGYGLTGWVRNTDDGDVELLVGGSGTSVDALLQWCQRGPKRAEVTSVHSREATAEELQTLPSSGFEVRR